MRAYTTCKTNQRENQIKSTAHFCLAWSGLVSLLHTSRHKTKKKPSQNWKILSTEQKNTPPPPYTPAHISGEFCRQSTRQDPITRSVRTSCHVTKQRTKKTSLRIITYTNKTRQTQHTAYLGKRHIMYKQQTTNCKGDDSVFLLFLLGLYSSQPALPRVPTLPHHATPL